MSISKITPCLWFDGRGEEAAQFYTSIFPNSSITHTAYYTDAGADRHGHAPGSVMVVKFNLNGTPFVALNGGPQFKPNEAISFQIECADQKEVDYYWDKLGEGGDPTKQACGWLADKFGISWQVNPKAVEEIFGGEDKEGAKRATVAIMKMKKVDIKALLEA
jgi:predicted 3-demethylubiquinone-9 3-methyltransferase (glyoxalase superfamily)